MSCSGMRDIVATVDAGIYDRNVHEWHGGAAREDMGRGPSGAEQSRAEQGRAEQDGAGQDSQEPERATQRRGGCPRAEDKVRLRAGGAYNCYGCATAFSLNPPILLSPRRVVASYA